MLVEALIDVAAIVPSDVLVFEVQVEFLLDFFVLFLIDGSSVLFSLLRKVHLQSNLVIHVLGLLNLAVERQVALGPDAGLLLSLELRVDSIKRTTGVRVPVEGAWQVDRNMVLARNVAGSFQEREIVDRTPLVKWWHITGID